ncbi:hypothetical protein Ppa06_18260 [Planomonospora parontospora subsp. parontospora]|uniref:Peptidase MA-like domain-containing protein n=2 Tax=Planomonospora parontospora TaxID=58119 RepID=A0AA37BFY0_9ACTN|nr:hypothetical protein [Planomonospora parontospora]GGK64996.1 hypothetical protein GCM10010126_25330 [Planomonospora parontospora]GII08028.1 hypothetical protein Ppa06_18260 [Planomonospora parontospora subsp. parontospora]
MNRLPRRTGLRAASRFLRRRWRWLIAGSGVLSAAVAVGVVLAFPSVAATACPGCYGLEELESGLYVESGLPAGRRRRVAEAVAAGERRVRDFYGGRTGSPRVLVCVTESCYRRIGGGGERGVAILDRAVMLSPRGIDPVIVSHELSHVELRDRLGSAADRIPKWFNEGLAVVVSDDPRYLLPGTAPDRCRVGPAGAPPSSSVEWLRAAGADDQVYARSACRVHRWLAANGGRAALIGLLERLAAGEEFALIVRQGAE